MSRTDGPSIGFTSDSSPIPSAAAHGPLESGRDVPAVRAQPVTRGIIPGQHALLQASPLVVHITSAHPANDPRIYEKECATLARAGFLVKLVATGSPPTNPYVSTTITWRPHRRIVRMTWGAALAIVRALCMRPKLVHMHDPELAPFLPLFRLFGIATVFDSHEDIVASLQDKHYLSPNNRKTAGNLGAHLVRYIDYWANGVVAATPSIASGFQSNKTCLIQNFPITRDWNADVDFAQRLNLVYVGGVSEARGAWLMLDALQILRSSRPNVRLKIAGTATRELLSELQNHPAWAAVDYLGVLNRRQVSLLLSETMIALVLFRPAHNHVESQPTKLFEYMAAGLPVVASDFPHWKTLVSEPGAGLVVDPEDTSAVAHAIASLLGDRESAEAMGRRGRSMSQRRHNWDIEGDRLVSFYNSLLAHPQKSDRISADFLPE